MRVTLFVGLKEVRFDLDVGDKKKKNSRASQRQNDIYLGNIVSKGKFDKTFLARM